MLISVVQQGDLVIYTHTHSFLHILFSIMVYHKILNIVLCYAARCLSILCLVAFIRYFHFFLSVQKHVIWLPFGFLLSDMKYQLFIFLRISCIWQVLSLMQLSDFSVFALQQFDYNEFILHIVYGGFWIGGFMEFISFGRIFDFFKYFPCSFSFVFFPWNSPNISVGQLGGVPPGSLGFV